MMHYYFNYSNKDAYIQITKDYSIQIEKSNNTVVITKDERYIDFEKEDNLDSPHFIFGHITANDVCAQLANIKHIGFEVTDACNLKCAYCAYGEFYNNYDNRTNKQIEIKKAKILIDFLVEKLNSPANNSPENEIVISFYGGEPLLNIRFIKEIVQYTQQIQNSRIKFNYSMTTNGIYLKKHIRFLFQYNFTILVSLDGSKENNAHRKFINGESSFKFVYNTLKYIQNTYMDYFEKKISFNTVMHNLNNIQDVFLFFQNEFEKVPRFSGVNPTGVKPGLEKTFEKLTRQKPFVIDEELYSKMIYILDLNSEQIKQLQDFIFQYSGNIYYSYSDLLVKRAEIDHLPTATCIPFSKRIFMTVNNKLLPCERIGHQFSLGKVDENGVRIDCNYIAEKYNGYYDSLREQCKGCYHKKQCTQCMFSIQNLEEKPVCDKLGSKRMFSEYLHKNMEILSNNPELYKRIMEEIIVIK